MAMSKVYIVKIPEVRINGEWHAKFTPTKAERYGTITKVLESGEQLLIDDIYRIDRILRNFTEKDYLLLGGSPLQIGYATYVAMTSVKNKAEGMPLPTIKFLIWDRKDNDYTIQEVLCE